MSARHLLSTVSLSAILAVSAAAQQNREWQQLYRDAIEDVGRQQWKQAEDKLQRAIKTGPASGRDVIKRNFARDQDYFPEYYLGIVYLNTNRPDLAVGQFALARKNSINLGQDEFRQLPTLSARAEELAKAMIPPAPPGPTPADRFKTSMDQGRRALADGRYAEATNAAKAARALGVDNGAADELLRSIDVARANARLREFLKTNPSLDDMRRAVIEYRGTGANLDELNRRIAEAEVAVLRDQLERAAMIAYYNGNYPQAQSGFTETEKKTGGLSIRGHFYRAVTLASLAIRGKTVNQGTLAQARASWKIANQRPDEFKADLRYISPQVLQALR